MMIISAVTDAQEIENYLNTVAENNPEIIAVSRLLEARSAEVRTGISPPDPSITFGYMPGNQSTSGVKKIWSVNQSFSFPLKYIIQKKLSRNYLILAEYEFQQAKLATLLDAELTLYDLIYRKKLLDVLEKRASGYNSLKSAWKLMLDNGEATILDYNKIIMEISSIDLEVARVKADISQITEKLQYLNGVSDFVPDVKEYKVSEEKDIEELLAEKSAFHPEFLIPEAEYQISLEEVRLSRAGSLPEIQLAYSSEAIPGETFAGPVGGITLPLWANSNRVKSATAFSKHAEAGKEAILSRLKSEVRSEYSVMLAMKKSIAELSSVLSESGDTKHYDIALENGEINIVSYFSYLDVIFSTEERLLQTECEYQKSLAKLNDYQLLK